MKGKTKVIQLLNDVMAGGLTTEQLSIFAGVGFVLSFLEAGGDSLELIGPLAE